MALRATVINGSIVVESEEDREKKRAERAKKRKSRWDGSGSSEGSSGPVHKQKYNVVPQLPSMINISNSDQNATEIYLCQMGIRECTNRLGNPTLGIPQNPRDRSPSPEPVYNAKGVRINTRYERTRQKLTAQRNNYISKLKKLDPTYQPPTYYKDQSLEDRIEVPQEQYPQYNFVGLILGPRGNHLKEMEQKTNTRIMIKGKGSIKDGMTGLRKDGTKWDDLDEPMHVTIVGQTGKGVKEAGDYLRKLIKMQVEDPNSEKMVAFRAASLHELAVLNGTLKDFQFKCLNCGLEGHKTWECPESQSVTFSTICTACGGVGHVTGDCKARRPGEVFNKSAGGEELDEEYSAFLDDMGIGGKKSKLEEEKPYVPPMGDLSSRLGGALGKSKPRLMLTNGSAAPGASIKAAKYLNSFPLTCYELFCSGKLQPQAATPTWPRTTATSSQYSEEDWPRHPQGSGLLSLWRRNRTRSL